MYFSASEEMLHGVGTGLNQSPPDSPTGENIKEILNFKKLLGKIVEYIIYDIIFLY